MATTDLDQVAQLDDLGDYGVPPTPLPMTEDQFVAWAIRREVWAEWADGEVVLMNSVNYDHGRLFSFLHRLIGDFTEAHDLGQTLAEPILVRLPAQRRQRSPDLFVFGPAKQAQMLRQCFDGAPDLIVEVVSPDSRHRDTVEKFAEYEAAGVPEYWLPDPALRTFQAFSLGGDGRYARLPEVDGKVYSTVLPGLYFRPEWVWQLRFPKVAPLLAEMAAERTRILSTPPPPTSDKSR